MSFAVLVWQVLIATTILFSGRYRTLVAVFWVVWTIVQVVTLPLSIFQFLTIGLAYWASFRSLGPASGMHRPLDRVAEPSESSEEKLGFGKLPPVKVSTGSVSVATGSSAQRLVGCLGILIAMVVVTLLASVVTRGLVVPRLFQASVTTREPLANAQTEYSRSTGLHEAVSAMNRRGPQMVAKDVRFDRVTSGNGRQFVYYYTVLSPRGDSIEPAEMVPDVDGALAQACTEGEIQDGLSRGIEYLWVYRRPSGEVFLQIALRQGICSKIAKRLARRDWAQKEASIRRQAEKPESPRPEEKAGRGWMSPQEQHCWSLYYKALHAAEQKPLGEYGEARERGANARDRCLEALSK